MKIRFNSNDDLPFMRQNLNIQFFSKYIISFFPMYLETFYGTKS